MRVAVVGGGLFGSTAAIHARRAGHEVHLFEAKPTLMAGATSACYYRLHRGYHYPRSPETGQESLAAEALFRKEYGEAVIDGGRQLYVIAHRSRVSAPDFGRFMRDMRLPYRQLDSHDLISDGCVFEVYEPRIDALMLGRLVVRGVEDAGVNVHTNTRKLSRNDFDQIIVATYANTNAVLEDLGCEPQPYRYQVVEKPIVEIPGAFRGTSIVVMDHCCVDPHQWSEFHALGHVSETIHWQNEGAEAYIPSGVSSMIERGVVRHYEKDVWRKSRVRETVASIADLIPGVSGCDYIGSMFTVRAVLAGQDQTDARPTLVSRMDDKVIRVFSGKLGTAVTAAQQAVAMLADEKAKVAA